MRDRSLLLTVALQMLFFLMLLSHMNGIIVMLHFDLLWSV